MDRYHFRRCKRRVLYWDPDPEVDEWFRYMEGQTNAVQRQRMRDLTHPAHLTNKAPRTTSPDRKRTRVRFT